MKALNDAKIQLNKKKIIISSPGFVWHKKKPIYSQASTIKSILFSGYYTCKSSTVLLICTLYPTIQERLYAVLLVRGCVDLIFYCFAIWELVSLNLFNLCREIVILIPVFLFFPSLVLMNSMLKLDRRIVKWWQFKIKLKESETTQIV